MSGSPPGQKYTAIMCPHCQGRMEVAFDYPWTAEKRMQAMKAAMDEHRRVCLSAPPEAQRVYSLSYPR